MKITLNDIVSNIDNLKALQEIKFPIKVSYRLKRLIDKLDPILTNYDEKRNELVVKYGEKQLDKGGKEDGTVAVKDPKRLEKFAVELKELLAIEETIDFETIKLSEVGDVQIETKSLISFVFSE